MERVQNYTVLDLEMTGLSPKTEKIIEIGAIRMRNGKEESVLSCLVNPGRHLPSGIEELTGITDEMVKNGEKEDIAIQKLLDFIGEDLLVGHNIRSDYSFLAQWCINKKKSIRMQAIDTLKIARALLPAEEPKKLDSLCIRYQVSREHAHRALDDARETAEIFEKMQDQLEKEPENLSVRLLSPALLQYKAKRQTPATAYQIRDLKEYIVRHQLKDEIVWEGLTRNEASRIMDRFYSMYGR